MALRKKGKYWYLYYRQGGRIVYKSLRTEDRMEAERNSNAIMAQVRYARHMGAVSSLLRGLSINPQNETPTDRSPALDAAVAQMNASAAPSVRKSRLPLDRVIETASKHRNMTDEHRREFKAFMESCGVEYADEVTPSIGLAYLDGRFGGLSAKRYNNALTTLNVVFRSCLVEAGMAASPFASIMPRRLTDVRHYREFSKQETANILDALKGNGYWLCLSMIALHTGLRLESCRRLRPSMIADGLITIMPGKTARFGRAVQIPLTDALKEHLGRIERKSPDAPYCEAFREQRYLMVGGKRYEYFIGVLESMGIRDDDRGRVGFHSWRETYITRLSEVGVPERVIRGIVGHSSQQMTDLYNHDSESALRERETIGNALRTD